MSGLLEVKLKVNEAEWWKGVHGGYAMWVWDTGASGVWSSVYTFQYVCRVAVMHANTGLMMSFVGR